LFKKLKISINFFFKSFFINNLLKNLFIKKNFKKKSFFFDNNLNYIFETIKKKNKKLLLLKKKYIKIKIITNKRIKNKITKKAKIQLPLFYFNQYMKKNYIKLINYFFKILNLKIKNKHAFILY
jgi:hypothetical protein